MTKQDEIKKLRCKICEKKLTKQKGTLLVGNTNNEFYCNECFLKFFNKNKSLQYRVEEKLQEVRINELMNKISKLSQQTLPQELWEQLADQDEFWDVLEKEIGEVL